MNAVTPRERVSQLVTELGVARNRDFKRAGIHTQYVGEACNAGLIERVGRGTYALSGHIKTPQQRIAEACKRVPQGVVCLFSALWFHGLVEKEPEAIWMAIDRKTREPRVDSVPIEFVLFSGNAMTQGVVNLRVGGVPVRVYSPMKTVADCFKYADKIGTDIGPKALAAAIRGNQYNRQKLLRFAEICRVKRAVAAAENARKQPEPDRPTKEAEMVPLPARVWDREVLQEQVWTQPIRQLAKKYGVSDVAIHKHCKKMGIELPGRGYWAKQTHSRSRTKE